MSVRELIDEVGEDPDFILDWKYIRERMHEEHKNASTVERVILLQAHKILMDAVRESMVDDRQIEDFENARSQDYKFFIAKESLIGENISVETLYRVTQREIAAGRMEDSHSLAEVARLGMAAPHLSDNELRRQAGEKQIPS